MKTTTIQFIGLSIVALVLIGFGIQNKAYEPELGLDNTIKAEHLLKAPKEKIIKSKEVDWIERKEDGTVENKGKIISYDYITDKKVDKNIVWDNDPYSSVELLEVKENGNQIGKFYIGDKFYKDDKGDVYEIEQGATTTLEIFEKATKVSFLKSLLGRYVLADTDTIYAGAGDGAIQKEGNSWDNSHDATVGNAAFPVIATERWALSQNWAGVTYIERGFFPVPTGATIDAGATIVSSTMSIMGGGTVYDQDNDGDDYVALVETTQPDETTLTTSDYNNCGAVDSPAEISNQIDLTIVTASTRWAFVLSDLTAVKTLGDASDCGGNTGWTCIGIREGHDILDNAIGTNSANYFSLLFSETTGTASDPYLLVEWTASAPPADDSGSQPAIWFD